MLYLRVCMCVCQTKHDKESETEDVVYFRSTSSLSVNKHEEICN